MPTHITDLKGRYRVSATAPTPAKQGDRYFDTTTGSLCYYDGTYWRCHAYTSTSSSTTTTTTTSTSTTSTSSSTSSSTTTSSSTSTTI